MTANQRRSGFRLPWASDQDESVTPERDRDETTTAAAQEPAATSATAQPAAVEPTIPIAGEPAGPDAQATDAGAPSPAAAAAPPTGGTAASDEPAPEFMRELVSAMRRVATETRDSSVSAARTAAEERVKQLEADAERRRAELRQRADADIAAIGEWAKAEAERIRREAEQRVTTRRSELEEQLAAEAARGDADTQAVRDRIAEYERELESFSAQLNEIVDPAAFAAAAKRMPRPPVLAAPPADAPAEDDAETSPAGGSTEATAPATPAAEAPGSATNGTAPTTAPLHPAEEEVLAARLAELDAALPPSIDSGRTESTEPITTEIVVKGLGSFGAITSFRQALAGVDGVDAVALRLGETGEFIFRTTHGPAFDVAGAITSLEGDAAHVERRGEYDLLVTLQRGR
jgi:hypothetical protein